MKLAEYIAKKGGEGQNLTSTIDELAAILRINVRTVWAWFQRGEAPPYAQLIMRVLIESTPDQRKRWFYSSAR